MVEATLVSDEVHSTDSGEVWQRWLYRHFLWRLGSRTQPETSGTDSRDWLEATHPLGRHPDGHCSGDVHIIFLRSRRLSSRGGRSHPSAWSSERAKSSWYRTTSAWFVGVFFLWRNLEARHPRRQEHFDERALLDAAPAKPPFVWRMMWFDHLDNEL